MSKIHAQDPKASFAHALQAAGLSKSVSISVDLVGKRVLATLRGLVGRAKKHAERVVRSTARKLGLAVVTFTYATAS